ncbi:MAG: serine dehydratase [Bacteroidia bacterium]|nr:MAG: serine dehydratase [Bacteroidia bacterium]
MARRMLGEDPVHAIFRFDPSGSLATTYRGQGSAMGLAAGLLGMAVIDSELVNSEKEAARRGLVIEYIIEPFNATHPNTYRSVITGKSGQTVEFTALSTGGGIIRLTELNGEIIVDDLDYIGPLMPVSVIRNAQLPFNNFAGFGSLIESGSMSLSDIARDYESSIGNITEKDVNDLALFHYRIMKDAITSGLSGTEFSDRILHRQSNLIGIASANSKLIPSELTNDIIASITAIMETKSSMGVIVAAPTAGSCGTLGGTLIPVVRLMNRSESQARDAILAAGLVGILIEMGAGFAAEEGGCQYECGSASGMTAAALVEIAGGTGRQAIAAASIALQNTLGMICDPVANRVEVPCLGKNIMAGLNALAAANMALAGYDHVIPLEEVIGAMKEVASSMDHRLRCTCKGGLSITATAVKIAGRLEAGGKD